MYINSVTDSMHAKTAVEWVLTLTYYSVFLVLIVGVCSNVLSLALFVKRLRKKITVVNIYLAVLAVCDCCCVFWYSLWYIFLGHREHPVDIVLATGCNVVPFLSIAPMGMSSLIITTLMVDRCIAIRHPFLYRRIQSTRRAVCTMIGLGLFVLAINWNLVGGMKPMKVEEMPDVYHQFHCRGRSDVIDVYYLTWSPWIQMIVAACVSMIILICNIAIVLAFHSKAPHERTEAMNLGFRHPQELSLPVGEGTSDNVANISRKQTNITVKKHGSRLTRLSIVLSFTFLILVTPNLILRIILTVSETREEPIMSDDVSNLLEGLFSFLLLINFSTNFWLYCFSTPSFRKDLREMLCCRKRHTDSKEDKVQNNNLQLEIKERKSAYDKQNQHLVQNNANK